MESCVTLDDILKIIDDLVALQEKRLYELGKRIYPKLTHEDMFSIVDIPALRNSPEYNYEDGILAAYKSIRYAIIARYKDSERSRKGSSSD